MTGFGPWFVVLAAALVLAAIFVWAFCGKIQPVINGAGTCENGTLGCYVAQNEIKEITDETTVDIEGTQGKIAGIDMSLYNANEIPDDILFLLPESRWYSTVRISCELEDGLYAVTFLQKPITPASFLTRGRLNQWEERNALPKAEAWRRSL
ncbi:MAG: hypothetical protein IKF55_03400 [Oscillospiraceae bacterium]|nr:hypothetical protein [Oscillospiraceae bacterium]